MVIKSNKKNPIAKDLFTKKYKQKVVKPKKRKVRRRLCQGTDTRKV